MVVLHPSVYALKALIGDLGLLGKLYYHLFHKLTVISREIIVLEHMRSNGVHIKRPALKFRLVLAEIFHRIRYGSLFNIVKSAVALGVIEYLKRIQAYLLRGAHEGFVSENIAGTSAYYRLEVVCKKVIVQQFGESADIYKFIFLMLVLFGREDTVASRALRLRLIKRAARGVHEHRGFFKAHAVAHGHGHRLALESAAVDMHSGYTAAHGIFELTREFIGVAAEIFNKQPVFIARVCGYACLIFIFAESLIYY